MGGEDHLFDRLAGIYGDDAMIVEQEGRILPAAFQTWSECGNLESVLRVVDGAPALDPKLMKAGAPHLSAIRAKSQFIHDGPVVSFQKANAGGMECVPATYFEMLATSDVLRAEYLSTPDGDLILRELAHKASGGAPLASGAGRAAAVGVTVLVLIGKRSGEQVVVIGKRRENLAADPGHWHVAPSGMVEPNVRDPLFATVRKELREELGLNLDDPERIAVLGLGWDLLRLRPDVCLCLSLPEDQIPLDGLAPNPREFGTMELVPTRSIGTPDFWRAHRPMTPAAAAAFALLTCDES